MAEVQINGHKPNSQINFFSDIPEGEAEIGEIESDILTERRGKFRLCLLDMITILFHSKVSEV